jgi:hypothetical protein
MRVIDIFLEGNVGTHVRNKIVSILVTSGYKVYMNGFYGPKEYRLPPMDGKIAEALNFQCMGGTGKRRKQCILWGNVSDQT